MWYTFWSHSQSHLQALTGTVSTFFFKYDSFSSLRKTVISLWRRRPDIKMVLKRPADWWKPSCKTLVKEVAAIEKDKKERWRTKFFSYLVYSWRYSWMLCVCDCSVLFSDNMLLFTFTNGPVKMLDREGKIIDHIVWWWKYDHDFVYLWFNWCAPHTLLVLRIIRGITDVAGPLL